MTDLNELSQALLAAVPEDGSSIGNQALMETLKAQFSDLTDEVFTAARETLLEQGVLRKGRGRGGAVLRVLEGEAAVAAPRKAKASGRAKQAKDEPQATGIEGLKKTLWAAADKLRADMDAAEYKHIVLGLIFLKYISDSFAARRAELTRRFADESDEYFLYDCDDELLAEELEDRDYYREVNAFWVPEGARWEGLRAHAKQADIGKRIDDALTLIEQENPRLKGILDKRYARAQLPDGKLGELVDLVSKIGFGSDVGEARDILGQVYEYFLGEFASAEGKKGGQFYTPASIVKTLVAVLAPHHGQVYDPCCGSGGMFVQSERFIEAHGGKLGDVAYSGEVEQPFRPT